MSVLTAVKEFKHSAHQIAAIQCGRDRLCARLPLDLRLIVMSFLKGSEATSLCSVSSSWNKLRGENERFARLLYRLMFGDCSARDMELFEFSADSSWRHRFHVQFGTARNWF